MPALLDKGLVEAIQGLLAEGQWSMRRIARELGVSRGSVASIAGGTRGARARVAPIAAPSGPPARCCRCGALAQMPCLACQVRALAGMGRTREGLGNEPLGLELKGEHRARYEQVRARKLSAIARGDVAREQEAA